MTLVETFTMTVDVQMINVADVGDVHDMADFPYGMALMVGYLRDKGFNTLMLQYPTWQKKYYIDAILESPAYLYGFQVNFENYVEIQELVKIIKKSNPNAKIIFGGPFVVSLYEELLKNDKDLDAVVLGEGEYTVEHLIELLKADDPDWKLAKGLAWRNDEGEVVKNDHRPAIANMNSMPFAARDSIPLEAFDVKGNYTRDVRITTSRGCTSNCSFCAVNVNSKWQNAKRWRGRSHINVVDEIQDLVERFNVKHINLQDSAFDDPGKIGAARTRLFCEEIIKRGLEITMKAYFRAHSVKEDAESIELYKLYKEAGIDILHIGAEAGSDYELEIYWKDATLADNFRSFRVLDELDLFFVHNGFIMFGPYSTMNSLRQNIRFLWENQRSFHWPNIDTTLILTPGAVMYETMEQEGRVLPRKNFWEVPAYEFEDPRILTLARYYGNMRDEYPHTHLGDSFMITAANIISRLKNKMNKPAATACAKGLEEFKDVFYRRRKELNDLSYQGFVDSLNRVEKDGPQAKLDPEPYFGKAWKQAIEEVQSAYYKLVEEIQGSGYGTAGLIWTAESTAWSVKNREHFYLETGETNGTGSPKASGASILAS